MSAGELPLRVGIAGLGGFAAMHHRAMVSLEAAGHCRLVCICDPRAEALRAEKEGWGFETRGVRVFTDYGRMLEECRGELDYVVVATPIPLHASMHAEAVAAGVAVYLEKPPTLDPAELERMIESEERASSATLVAFNYQVEEPRLALKRRLLAGEFGPLFGASLRAFSPRPKSYFTRAPWAGRTMMEGRLVLDSCLGNAMAHSLHNMLFWAGGQGLHDWAEPETARAAFFRAHASEGPDTVFVSASLAGGAPLRIALTHAGHGPSECVESVECEAATIVCEPGRFFEVRWRGGAVERRDASGFDGVRENHLAYQRYLRGEFVRPATTLADSRPFVALHAMAWIAAGRITPLLSRSLVVDSAGGERDEYLEIAGLADAQRAFVDRGEWPRKFDSEAGAGGTARKEDLPRLIDAATSLSRPVSTRAGGVE